VVPKYWTLERDTYNAPLGAEIPTFGEHYTFPPHNGFDVIGDAAIRIAEVLR